jgi:hypothetical protein
MDLHSPLTDTRDGKRRDGWMDGEEEGKQAAKSLTNTGYILGSIPRVSTLPFYLIIIV